MKVKRHKHSPRLAQKIIGFLIDEEIRYTALGDYEEEFHRFRQHRGLGAANLIYWMKIAGLLPVFLIESFIRSLIMMTNYVKTAARNLKKQMSYSLINIVGLSIGIACFLLILFYIQYEFSYEAHNFVAKSVFHIHVEHHRANGEIYPVPTTPIPLASALGEEIPEIENYNRFSNLRTSLIAFEDKRFYEENMYFADPGAIKMFGFSMLSGLDMVSMEGPYSAVITREIAEKYFGGENPEGKILTLNGDMSITVRGVLENTPQNSEYRPDILISFSTVRAMIGDRVMNDWVTNQVNSYILVNSSAGLSEIEEKINGVYRKYAPDNDVVLRMERLDRLHLYSSVMGNGDIRTVNFFIAVGLLILLTACINFMNLSTARSSKRAREVGLRKVVGASRIQLIRQFLGESYYYSALSMFIAILLVNLLLPVLRSLTGQALTFSLILNRGILLSLVLVFIGIGFLSGSYPALVLSSFQPVSTLKGFLQPGGKSAGFRKFLVVTQFSISIILIIFTLIMGRQIDFMRRRNPGFKKDQIVVIRNRARIRDIEPLKHELFKHPHIVNASGSMMLPSRIGLYNAVSWEDAPDDQLMSIMHNTVDWDFLETFEIELVKGRGFSRDFPSDMRNDRNPEMAGSLLINETAAERFGWDDPIGKRVINVHGERRYQYQVVGVIRDFHFASLRESIQPLKIFLNPGSSGYISVKVKSDEIDEVISYIESAWNRLYSDMPFNYFFLDAVFEAQYQDEVKLQTLFRYFSLLVVFISCLGLLGLSAFSAEQRTREMGIRKVLGASGSQLTFLYSIEFTRWVLAANVIAWPLAWWALQTWLRGFAYHVEMYRQWIVFPLAALISFVIAWMTVTFQVARAATRHPVKSLRHD